MPPISSPFANSAALPKAHPLLERLGMTPSPKRSTSQPIKTPTLEVAPTLESKSARPINPRAAVQTTAETRRRSEKQGCGMTFFHFRSRQ